MDVDRSLESIQGSDEWLAFRRKGIGSSDSSVLMGLNKFKTIQQLWLEKTGQIVPEKVTAYLALRGTRMEPEARRAYINYTKINVEDKIFVHPKFDFVRASLDGWNEARKLILEIKCPTSINHYRAVVENWIKPEYFCQMQHQYIATNAQEAHYWSFDGKSGHLINVLPDRWFMGELLERELIFWECVEKMQPPDPEEFKKP